MEESGKFSQDIETESELHSSPEKEIGNQGLRKRIIRRGVTWQTPFRGDEVEVHYSGQVKDSSVFDSSRDKGTPFKFKLGQCEVIKGWDEGVATMKKGERAIFTIPPHLAYGEVGCPPLIPPNSTLIFDIEMLSWSTIRDLTGDGGVLKKIIEEGEGWAAPKDGDEVTVKYEAKLVNGVVVYRSEDSELFHIGDGSLCPAIHKAVKTMKMGEKAELSVRFSYGFRHCQSEESGTDGVIPPGSNVSIHLELLSWRSVVDIVGDGKILKKIIKSGEGFDRPNEGSLVKVIYVAKLEDGSIFDSKGCDEEPFEYECLEEKINEGLDRAIMTMRKGEKAYVTLSCEYMHPNIEAQELAFNNSRFLYEVELIDFTKEKPFWKMETREKMETCEKKKQDGNLLFKAGKFWHASKKYEKAVKYVEFNHSFTDEEKRVASALHLSCELNNAACKLKLGEYLEASRLCTKALELDPCNVKALFRRSQAYIRTSELDRAKADIERALAIDPNNRDIKLELKVLKDKQKEYDQNQAKLFGTMLSKIC